MRTLLLVLLLTACICGPALFRGEYLGDGRAELYGHAWVQAWASAAWPAWPTGTDLALGTAQRPIIDPLPTWIAAGLGRIIGLKAAWNVLVVGAMLLCGVGGAALGRAAGVSGSVVAAGVMLSPIWRGSVQSGLTEDYWVGLPMLAIAVLLRAEGWRDGVLAGLLLGLTAWCGLYLAWMGAVVAGLVGLWRCRQGWRIGRVMGVGGAVALCVAMPALSVFAERAGGEGHRSGQVRAQTEPLWRVNPWRAADVGSFVVPCDAAGCGEVELGDAFVRTHPTWVGWPVLGLAVRGVPGMWPVAVGVGLVGAWSLGEKPSVLGEPGQVGNPIAKALDGLPYAGAFNHHARLWMLGQVGLVVLAAGAQGRWRWLLVGGMVLDAVFLAPIPLGLAGTMDTAPPIYAKLRSLPEGPVAVIDSMGPGVHPQRVFFDQRKHGRKLLHNPDRMGPVAVAKLAPGTIIVSLGRAVPGLGTPVLVQGSASVWIAN